MQELKQGGKRILSDKISMHKKVFNQNDKKFKNFQIMHSTRTIKDL